MEKIELYESIDLLSENLKKVLKEKCLEVKRDNLETFKEDFYDIVEEIEKIKTDYSIRDLENTAEKQLEDIFILKRMSIEEIEVKLNCFFRLKKTEYYIKHYIETGCTDNYMEIMFDIGRFAYTINIYYLDTHEEEKKYITEVSVAIEIDL